MRGSGLVAAACAALAVAGGCGTAGVSAETMKEAPAAAERSVEPGPSSFLVTEVLESGGLNLSVLDGKEEPVTTVALRELSFSNVNAVERPAGEGWFVLATTCGGSCERTVWTLLTVDPQGGLEGSGTELDLPNTSTKGFVGAVDSETVLLEETSQTHEGGVLTTDTDYVLVNAETGRGKYLAWRPARISIQSLVDGDRSTSDLPSRSACVAAGNLFVTERLVDKAQGETPTLTTVSLEAPEPKTVPLDEFAKLGATTVQCGPDGDPILLAVARDPLRLAAALVSDIGVSSPSEIRPEGELKVIDSGPRTILLSTSPPPDDSDLTNDPAELYMFQGGRGWTRVEADVHAGQQAWTTDTGDLLLTSDGSEYRAVVL